MDKEIKEQLAELSQLMKISSVSEEERNFYLEIVNALRNGVPPERGLLKFSVGRESLLRIIRSDLQLVRRGKSKLRYINGHYGSGKTHVLYILREFAFENGFAASFVTLTPRECPLDDMARVYSHIVKGLRTTDCRESPALEVIIAAWANRILEMGANDRLRALGEIKSLSVDFQNVLTHYLESVRQSGWDEGALAIKWIQGDVRTKREAAYVGARSCISEETALEMLSNLVLMLKVIGFGGLVILLDEAESLSSVSGQKGAQPAFDNLLRLINCNLDTSNSYFVYATTPSLLEAWKRYTLPPRLEKDIIDLGPLRRETVKELAIHLRNTHLKSYEWSDLLRLSNSTISRYADKYLSLHDNDKLVRDFVRTTISSLDICQQNSKITLEQTLRSGSGASVSHQ